MEFEDQKYSVDSKTFQVHGTPIMLFSPTMARITINVPWPKTDGTLTSEQKAFIIKTQGSIVKYLFDEELLDKGPDVAIMVVTKHPIE